MKKLFYYCTYRIAKFYKNTRWAHDYVAQGYFLLFFSLTCYVLAILHVVLFMFNIKLNKTIIVIACIPLIFEIVSFNRLFPNAQDNYNNYEKEKNNERYRSIKGWLVFLFLFFSLISFILVSYILRV